MNKRGWIRIVEASFAILLLAGVVLVALSQSYIQDDKADSIYGFEENLLNKIKLNNSLREDIFAVNESDLPISLNDFDSNGLNDLKFLILNTPLYLKCEANLCKSDDLCEGAIWITESVYVRSIILSAESGVFSPRQLKLFCWVEK